MEVNAKDIYTYSDLNKVVSSKQTNTDIIIREGNINTLGEIENANGLLGFCDSIIGSLVKLKEVKGDFFISIYTIDSNLKTLENLETVHGDLYLRYSNIEDLGALRRVNGKLNLRDTKISSLGQLEFVGGDMYLPKKIENKINLGNITIKGEVKFWNDSKTKKNIIQKNNIGFTVYGNIPIWTDGYIYQFSYINFANSDQKTFYNTFKQFFLDGKYIDLQGNHNYSFVLLFDLFENHKNDLIFLDKQVSLLINYYPRTKIIAQDLLCRKIQDSGDFEYAWHLLMKKEYISIQKIIEYSNKLNKNLLTGELILKIADYSFLSEFGQKNINQIIPFAEIGLENYIKEKNCNFFDLFLQNGRPIKSRKTIVKSSTKKILGFFKKHTYETIYEYDPDYYKDCFCLMMSLKAIKNSMNHKLSQVTSKTLNLISHMLLKNQ